MLVGLSNCPSDCPSSCPPSYLSNVRVNLLNVDANMQLNIIALLLIDYQAGGHVGEQMSGLMIGDQRACNKEIIVAYDYNPSSID